jgi:hypothetical protein
MTMPSKICKCGNTYQPYNTFQTSCIKCLAANAKKKRERKEVSEKKEARREHRKAKERIKSRGQWLREAQAAFNKYIRLRDAAEPCISCGRHHTGQYHAGHYRSVGSAPELRFEELNCHKQDSVCNNHLSGNLIEYRKRLLVKIGHDKLDWLEGPHEPKKYTIDEIKEIKAKYAKMAREMENDR